MKIVIVADVLGPENNGTTTACMNLVRYLKSCGDEVSVICCDESKKGIAGYYVVGTYNMGPLINYMVKRNNVSLAKPDKNIIREAIKDADIVHIMMPFALGTATIKIAKEMGKPVSAGFHVQAENFTSHILMKNVPLANHLTYKYFYNSLYQYVDAVHYPTKFIKDLFENAVGHKTNGYVISNGVHSRFVKRETEKPDALKDKFVILFTGRFSREKSHTVLIKAVAKSKYKDKIQLIFAGQGPTDTIIKNCAKIYNVPMPIMAFFSKDELVDVINYSDLYCHPAEIEIEAIACLEAISCGLVPVISNSPRCATKDFAVNSNNLFKCNDSKDLASKIDFWIEHPALREKQSREYVDYTKKYGQEECMKAMRRMMEDCIKGNKE